VTVELARLRGRRPVLLALTAGVAATGALAVGAVRDVLGGADVASAGESRGVTLVVLLAVLALSAGAGTAGSDWSTGSLRAQLLVDPRRSRLWLAKCLAVTGGALVASALLLAGFWAGLLVTVTARGLPLTAAAGADVVWFSLRAVALVALAALGGQALVLTVRFTAAALVLVLVTVLAGDALVGLLPLTRPALWGLRVNVLAWLRAGAGVPCTRGLAVCARHDEVSLAHGAVCLGTVLAATLLVSWFTFRRRAIP
jgi:hypothetical protein